MAHRNAFYLLSFLLSILLVIASGMGLLKPEVMYAKESQNWFLQSVGQDIINLVIVLPSLIITSFFIYRDSQKALVIWAGVLLYLVYTFLIYCFAIHFNQLFLVYCWILGLSFYLFAWFVFSQYRAPFAPVVLDKKILQLTGIYIISVASIFYVLWLLQIVPSNLQNVVPAETENARLVTNPVHVLDLSVCLPGIFIAGILLMRGHRLANLLAPGILSFFVLMDLTIAGLMIIMRWRGYPVNVIVLAIMLVLAFFSAILLSYFLRKVKIVNASS